MPIETGEEGFKNGLVNLIKSTHIDPEAAPSLADEVYLKEFGFDVGVHYEELLGQ